MCSQRLPDPLIYYAKISQMLALFGSNRRNIEENISSNNNSLFLKCELSKRRKYFVKKMQVLTKKKPMFFFSKNKNIKINTIYLKEIYLNMHYFNILWKFIIYYVDENNFTFISIQCKSLFWFKSTCIFYKVCKFDFGKINCNRLYNF